MRMPRIPHQQAQRRRTTHYFLPASPRPQRARQGPHKRQAELKAAYWQIFQTDDLDADPGQQLVDAVQTRIDAFARRYSPCYPAEVRCLLADRAQLLTYPRFPPEYH